MAIMSFGLCCSSSTHLALSALHGRAPRELIEQETAARDFLFSETLAVRVHLMEPSLVQQLITFYDWSVPFSALVIFPLTL